MKIIKEIKVPTGTIFIAKTEKGLIEFLSIGDYGQDVNLNQNKPVLPGTPLLPLTEKWVVTISTQYGCSMGCNFCDVPKVGPGINASFNDMMNMVALSINRPGIPLGTKRLNIHFARMGEPTLNMEVLTTAIAIKQLCDATHHPHPVVSTMMPKSNRLLREFLDNWIEIKNVAYEGNAGLQISINSTDGDERDRMFNGNALGLIAISNMLKHYRPVGRKITLNFAVAGYKIDCDLLADLFSPDRFIVKLTPMHKTEACVTIGLKTEGDYTSPEPYRELESRFQKAGFETLVFIASRDEDESRITCGNAIISGTYPKEDGFVK